MCLVINESFEICLYFSSFWLYHFSNYWVCKMRDITKKNSHLSWPLTDRLTFSVLNIGHALFIPQSAKRVIFFDPLGIRLKKFAFAVSPYYFYSVDYSIAFCPACKRATQMLSV